MNGFLNIDKPQGITSHDCVAQIRKTLKIKRVGHAGTLDPSATGVLPIAIGKATRLINYLSGNKSYHATIRFGIKTTTDDLEGEILATHPHPHLTLEQISPLLSQFIGTIQQLPPKYSAISVAGKRLYELARQGKEVQIPIRSVQIYDIKILAWRPTELPEIDLDISCGSGTYIRAIARDLGNLVQTGATLAKLIRTSSNNFHLTNSLPLKEISSLHIIPPDQPLSHLQQLILSPIEAQKWCQGQKIITSTPLTPYYLKIYDSDHQFLGIGKLIEQLEQTLIIPQIVYK